MALRLYFRNLYGNQETKARLGAHVSIYPSARVRVYEMTRPTLDMLGYDAPQEEAE